VKFAGTESWAISIEEWAQQLEVALWVRAVERIPVEAGGEVPGPLDVDPVPTPSVASGEPLREDWLFWWHAALRLLLIPPQELRARFDDLEAFGPPAFEGLDAYPDLQRATVARWHEAQGWHMARKRAGIEAMRQAPARQRLREGEIVRAVEAEIGHKASPFALRLVILPVADDEIRSLGNHTFLVPERLRATDAYERWLYRVVRALS
jgi:hypothetical protein